MVMVDVALRLPKDLLSRAERLASRQGTTLSGLVAVALERIVAADDEAYDQARKRSLALMEEGFDLGTYGRPPATRDELHER
ncbi:MAG: CopG family transcriptional regulator [Anaerolineae bacterium]